MTKNYIIDTLLEDNAYHVQKNFEMINNIMKENNMFIHDIDTYRGYARICHNHYEYSNYCNKHYLTKEELKDLKDDLKNIREEIKYDVEIWNFTPYLSFKTVKDLENSLYHYFYKFENYFPNDEFIKETIRECPELFESFGINPKTKEIYKQV